MFSRRELRRLAEQSDHWRNPLFDERGLWTREMSVRSWVLDDTEGPCRIRYGSSFTILYFSTDT